ncbi:MAG: response regulator, partial [Limisphaerales bacterium]
DEDDQFMIKRTFKKISNGATVQVAQHGQEAIDYMMGKGKFGDRQKFEYPSFILIDLKMPIADGFAVLDFLKKHPLHRIIPAVMLSASADLDDIKRAYMLGASSYHVKPNSSVELEKMLTLLYGYWMSCEVPQVDKTGKQLPTKSHGKMGERFTEPV